MVRGGFASGMLALCVAGCAHHPEFLTGPTPPPAPDHPGCYVLLLGRYKPERHFGADGVYIHPPQFIELMSELSPIPAPQNHARTVRMMSAPVSYAPPHGQWWPTEKGGLRIVWGSGLSGVDILLSRSDDGYAGTAETFWDFPRSTQTAVAKMLHVVCPTDGTG